MIAKKLIAFGVIGTAAYMTYRLYKDRDQIKESMTATEVIGDNIATDLQQINEKLEIINVQQDKLHDIRQELTHKYRVFSQETQPQIAKIKNTVAKYQDKVATLSSINQSNQS